VNKDEAAIRLVLSFTPGFSLGIMAATQQYETV